MLKQYLNLKKEYFKTGDVEVLKNILGLFNIECSEICENATYVYLTEYYIKFINLKTHNVIMVHIKEDEFITINVQNNYSIFKYYLLSNPKTPYQKVAILKQNDREKICLIDLINNDTNKRILKKDIYFDENNYSTVFYKIVSSHINRPSLQTINTYTDDFNTAKIVTTATNMDGYYYYSDKIERDDGSSSIESLFIEKPLENISITQSNNSLIDEALNSKNAILMIKETLQNSNCSLKFTATKRLFTINIDISIISDNKETKTYQTFIPSSTSNVINLSDLNAICNLLKENSSKNEAFVNVVEKIKKAYLKDCIKGYSNDDEIDNFLQRYDNDGFEYMAFNIYYNLDSLSKTIDRLIYKSNKEINLGLKK